MTDLSPALPVNGDRLVARLKALGQVGALPDGGVCRLALTPEDGAGRDLVVNWMREQKLEVAIDPIGNIFGTRKGTQDGPSVMIGSHIDTVATGGLYDGNLGVTRRPGGIADPRRCRHCHRPSGHRRRLHQ